MCGLVLLSRGCTVAKITAQWLVQVGFYGMAKEAKARILINDLLRRSAWRFFDDDNGPANVVLELNIKVKKNALDSLGDDFENTANGFVDYLLLDEQGFPLAVLEAKSENFDPSSAKKQARKYARALNVRSSSFPTATCTISGIWTRQPGSDHRVPDAGIPGPLPDVSAQSRESHQRDVDEDYVAVTQNPNYASDPRWQTPASEMPLSRTPS